MADAAVNTKVELVVESVEDLANAIFDGRKVDRSHKDEARKATQAVLDAREALRDSLREFLAPRLRVLEGFKRPQAFTPDTDEADKPKCDKCQRTTPCPLGHGTQCPAWAAAVRAKRVAEPGDVA